MNLKELTSFELDCLWNALFDMECSSDYHGDQQEAALYLRKYVNREMASREAEVRFSDQQEDLPF